METTRGPRHAHPARIGPLALDTLLAVVFTAFSLVVTHAIARDSTDRYDAWTIVAIVVIGGAVALRRVVPVVALAVQTLVLGVYTWADFAGGPIYLAPMVLLYTIAAEGDRRRTWWTAGAVMAAFVVLAATGDDPRAHVAYLAAFGGWAAGALFLGRATANRRQYLGELEQRARHLEETREEEARRRVAEERLRIARDLHDAVAHGMATIHLRAGAALHVLERNPEEAERALRAIKDVSKDTLGELRATLGMLRGDDAAPLAPTPGLDRVDDLVAATRRAGLEVELDERGERTPLPLAVDVAAYRIVQESLTNVIKHAGRGVTARVVVGRDADAIEIDVVDDGRGSGPNGGRAPSGHGIEGMAERAASVGGTLAAGPRADGGFAVHARLPIRAASPLGVARPVHAP